MLGIIGAGQMGTGIAQVAAQAGLNVQLLDDTPERARHGFRAIASQLDARVATGKLTAEQRDATLGRIDTGADLALLATADFVIEAATESAEIKRRLFEAADRVAPAHAVL